MSSGNRVKNIRDVFDAIVNYIFSNSTFESTEAISAVIKKIESTNSIEDLFRIPIEDRLYNFTNALQWFYFICFIINTIKDEQIIIPSTFNINFSTDTAIIYLSNTYNEANKLLYSDYFNNSDSESDE